MLQTIAKTGRAFPALSFLTASGVTDQSSGIKLSTIFQQGFGELSSYYRTEYVYKAEIANHIVFKLHGSHNAAMQVEMPVGRSIVDVAVFNGTSTAYEIKTEFDTPKRLISQTTDYLRAFDRVYLVTHPRLALRFEASLDYRVGILTLHESHGLKRIRPAKSNCDQIDPNLIFRMLHRKEYMAAVEAAFGLQRELPNGLVFGHYEKLFAKLPNVQAHHIFLDALRNRRTDNENSIFLSALPSSLRALAYATPLSAPQRQRLLSAIDSPVPIALVT